MKKNLYGLFALLITAILLAGCGQSSQNNNTNGVDNSDSEQASSLPQIEDNNHTIEETATVNETKLTANAGKDIVIEHHKLFTLDGSQSSTNVDMTQMHYQWLCIENNNSCLYEGNQSIVTLPAELPVGIYHIKLIILNENNQTAEDIMVLTVTEAQTVSEENQTLPITESTPALIEPTLVANAGSEITIEQGALFTFDASKSYSLDSEIVSYEWFCTDLNISLFKTDQSTLTLPAQRPTDTYHVKLIITDENGMTAEDMVIVTVIDPQLVADAGQDIIVEQHDFFTFDASQSYSLNSTIVSYEWFYTDFNISLSKSDQSILTMPAERPVGTYHVKLIVTDENNRSAEEILIVRVIEPGLVADAGADIMVDEYASFTLDATQSTSLDSTIINYKWICQECNNTLYSGAESIVSLAVEQPVGIYTLTLITTNDKNQTAEDRLTLTITSSDEQNTTLEYNDTLDIGIDVEELKMLQEHNIVYIDIRTAQEWEGGSIDGAYKMTKPNDLNEWLQEGSEFLNLVTDQKQSFVLICASGSRAYVIANTLFNEHGYEHVHYLKGGTSAWVEAGESLIVE